MFKIGLLANWIDIFKPKQKTISQSSDREHYQITGSYNVGAAFLTLGTFNNKYFYVTKIIVSKALAVGGNNISVAFYDSDLKYQFENFDQGSTYTFDFNPEPLRFRDEIRIVSNEAAPFSYQLCIIGYLYQ